MNCKKCNTLIPDNAIFCPKCGQKNEPASGAAQDRCPKCGTPLDKGIVFCGVCGTQVGMPRKEAPKTRKNRFKLRVSPKVLGICAGVAAAAALVILAVTLLSGGKNSYAVYIMENQLHYAMPEGEETIELTSEMLCTNTPVELLVLDPYIKTSEDGKKLFYPDKIEAEASGQVIEFTLYCQQNGNKKDAVKIDSGVRRYAINPKGNLVVYEKKGNLYRHNLSEKVKIADDVMSFRLSEDGKTLMYTTREEEEYALYIQKGNKDGKKIASNIRWPAYSNKDLSVIMYLKGDSLYVKKGNSDPEKIDSGVTWLLRLTESGEAYYTKDNTQELTYWDVIENDMGEDGERYYSDWLSELTIDNQLHTLYYFDGKDSAVIGESVVQEYYGYDNNAAVLVFQEMKGEYPTVKLSDYIEEGLDLQYMFDQAAREQSQTYIAVGGTCEALDVKGIYEAHFEKNGQVVYVCADYEQGDSTVSVYKIDISDGKVQNCELFDEDVSTYCNRLIVGETSLLYIKEQNSDMEGELYLDGEMIDDDVFAYRYSYNDANKCIYYYKDWDYDDQEGTLMYYNGKKSATVKDEVYKYGFTPAGHVLFLHDYSINSHKGELWVQNGKKNTRMEDDVTNFFTGS